MESLAEISKRVKAPVAQSSLTEKVETVERRLNGKVLPFVGLHGMLLTLFYLLNDADPLKHGNPAGLSWLAMALGLSAIVITAIYLAYRATDRARDVAGSMAVAAILFLTASLLISNAWLAIGIALAVFLALLATNARGWIGDYDVNTVFVYLPLVFFAFREFSIPQYIGVAVTFFGPAVFVKFHLQPKASKLPIGVGILVFLGSIIGKGSDARALVGVLVFLALLLFVIYAIRNRNATGSCYRHFLYDFVVMGLWFALLFTFGLPADKTIILWGFGVLAHGVIAIAAFKKDRALEDPAAAAAARDAHLVWIQIGCFAFLYQYLVETVLVGLVGLQSASIGVLMIFAPFIPVYRFLKSSFLALSTRLWIGSTLFVVALDSANRFRRTYLGTADDKSVATLRSNLLENYSVDLAWIVLAVAIGLAATVRVPPVRRVAWWRGLIWPKHMVLFRNMGRMVIANANRIAFVGGFLSALAALLKWMGYAGGEQQGAASRNLMLLAAHVFGVAMTIMFGRFLIRCCSVAETAALRAPLLSFLAGDLVYVLAWCSWGVFLYVFGVLFKDYLARFFATGFVLMPLVMFDSSNTLGNHLFFAKTVMVCSIAMFCLGLLRRIAR